MKIIKICGSLKFRYEMKKIAMQLETIGNMVLVPIFIINEESDTYSEEELDFFHKIHKEEIKLADTILVVNVNGYIGNDTKSDIELAKALEKEIVYYTDLIGENK